MLLATVYIIGSILLLYFGAEFCLDSAEKIGKKMGLSPLFIGMVIIGFGTSLPEFFVSHIAVIEGKQEMAIGSLVGSNISNLFLILGISSMIVNLKTGGINLLRHLLIHLILAPVLYFVFQSKSLNGLSSVLLLSLITVYMFILYKDMKRDRLSILREEVEGSTFVLMFKVLLGFVFLYLGGELLVKGGTILAFKMGVSEYVISVILLAFGTSLPELITCVIACIKRIDTDVIVGNIIGSNLFNCALIMGSLGLYDIQFTMSLSLELIILAIGALSLILLNLFKFPLNKAVGAVYLAIYLFMVYNWLS